MSEHIKPNHKFLYHQVHAGTSRHGKRLWHSGSDFKMWSGDAGKRTPGELYEECKSTMRDLERLYPSLREADDE